MTSRENPPAGSEPDSADVEKEAAEQNETGYPHILDKLRKNRDRTLDQLKRDVKAGDPKAEKVADLVRSFQRRS